MAVEKVVAQIVAEVDDQSLKKAGDDMKSFARDTKKEIDKNLLYKIIVDKAQAKIELDTVRALLSKAKKDGDKELILKYTIQSQELQSKVTEIGRSLNNLKNTGEVSVSRIGQLFDMIAQKLGGVNTIAGRTVTAVGQSFTGMGNSIAGFGAKLGVAAIGTVILGIGKEALNAGDKFEQASISFETMLGSADKAKLLLEDLAIFAKSTPFELTGLRDTTKQLLAFGIESDQIIPTLKSLGDISAGLGGPDALGRLTYVFGQVRAAGKLMGSDLRQFTELGIPLTEELSKSLGKSTAEIQDMVSNGEISFGDVQQVLKNMSSEGGEFFNLMGKQSDTLSGKWSNLKDNAGIILQQIGEALLPFAKAVVDAFNWLLQKTNIVFVGLNIMAQKTIGFIIDSFINLQIFFTKFQAGLQIIFSNIGVFFSNFSDNMGIIARNIGTFIGNIPGYIENALNLGIQKIENFLNTTINGINNFGKALGLSTNIGTVKLGTIDTSGLVSGYESLISSNEKLNNSIATTADTRISELQAFKKAHQDSLEETLNEMVLNVDKQKDLNTEMTIDNKKNLDTQTKDKSKATKTQKDLEEEAQKKQVEMLERNKKYKDKLREEEEKKEENKNKKLKSNLDALSDAYKEGGDIYGDVIDKAKDKSDEFSDKIKDLQEDIKDLNKDLADLESEKVKTLGERFVETGDKIKDLNKEIKDLKDSGINESIAQSIGLNTLKIMSSDSEIGGGKVSDLIKLLELQKELNDLKNEQILIQQNITDSQITEAQRVAGLSETAKYLEEFEIKKQKILDDKSFKEQEILNLQTQKDTEAKIIEDFNNKKAQLDENYKNKVASIESQITDKTLLEVNKRLSYLEELRQKAIATAEAMRTAGVSTTTTTINNNPNVTVNANLSNNVDVNNLGNQLADKVSLSKKGID